MNLERKKLKREKIEKSTKKLVESSISVKSQQSNTNLEKHHFNVLCESLSCTDSDENKEMILQSFLQNNSNDFCRLFQIFSSHFIKIVNNIVVQQSFLPKKERAFVYQRRELLLSFANAYKKPENHLFERLKSLIDDKKEASLPRTKASVKEKDRFVSPGLEQLFDRLYHDDIKVDKFSARQRFELKHKFTQFETIPVLSEDQKNTMCAFFLAKEGIKNFCFVGDNIEMEHLTEINKFTRPKGYFESVSKLMNMKITFKKIKHKQVAFNQLKECPINLSFFYTHCRYFLSQNYIPLSQINNALLTYWEDVNDKKIIIDMMKALEGANDRNSAKRRKENKKNLLFKNETALKCKDSCFSIFYSNDVLKFVIETKHEMLFIDGTYLKKEKGAQLLIMRFYHSQKHFVTNAVYIHTQNKDAETYIRVFKHLADTGLFDSIKTIMTDYELAIGSAFSSVLNRPILNRLCYFHFCNALKIKTSKINCVIKAGITTTKVQATKNIFNLFSNLAFVLRINNMFELFCLIVRLSEPQPNAANELFFDYFSKTYVTGRFSKLLYIDFDLCPVHTNNSLEGVNSGFKRFALGKQHGKIFEEWIALNIKKTILKLETTCHYSTNQHLLELQKLYKAGDITNMLHLIGKKLESYGGKKSSGTYKQEYHRLSIVLKKVLVSDFTDSYFRLTFDGVTFDSNAALDISNAHKQNTKTKVANLRIMVSSRD